MRRPLGGIESSVMWRGCPYRKRKTAEKAATMARLEDLRADRSTTLRCEPTRPTASPSGRRSVSQERVRGGPHPHLPGGGRGNINAGRAILFCSGSVLRFQRPY